MADIALCRALESKLGPVKKPQPAVVADKRAAFSICVLPFANMSGDAEQEYFSDGDNGATAATRALEIDGALAEAHAAKAGILAATGHYDDAQAEIETALRLDPDSIDVHREAARLRFHQKRFQEAIVHWEKVLATVESDYASGPLLITCYTALGDQVGLRRVAVLSLERAERAVAVEADNGSAMGAVVSCLVALGRGDRAREWMRRDPDFDPIRGDSRYSAMVEAAERRIASSLTD